MNAEPPRELLTGSVITPTEVFYIRNHLPVPRIDEAQYSLRIEGQGIKTVRNSGRLHHWEGERGSIEHGQSGGAIIGKRGMRTRKC